MITVPLAGRLTDKVGAGKIVLAGLALFAVGVPGLSQISGTIAFWQVELMLFTVGLGAGATLMPAMSATLGTLRHDKVARATSGLNVMLRVGGSLGTALFAAILASQRQGQPPSTLAGKEAVSGMHRPLLGEAFGQTFLWSLVIVALAVVAALFLPRTARRVADIRADLPTVAD
jgi:MFS family permease